MSVKKLVVGAAVVVLSVAACNKNPRSDVRNGKEREGTSQTGMVSTKPVPAAAAVQPADQEVISAVDTMASDGGVWTTADAGGVGDAGIGTTTIDGGGVVGRADAAIDASLR